MNSPSILSTSQIEQKLNGIAAILQKKNHSIATDLDTYSKKSKCDNAPIALLLHLAINTSIVAALYCFLY